MIAVGDILRSHGDSCISHDGSSWSIMIAIGALANTLGVIRVAIGAIVVVVGVMLTASESW